MIFGCAREEGDRLGGCMLGGEVEGSIERSKPLSFDLMNEVCRTAVGGLEGR